jgi:hypothetical protein
VAKSIDFGKALESPAARWAAGDAVVRGCPFRNKELAEIEVAHHAEVAEARRRTLYAHGGANTESERAAIGATLREELDTIFVAVEKSTGPYRVNV